MTAQFTSTQIKLEGVDPSENVTEIQSYLEGFQKEIESSDGTVHQVTEIDADENDGDGEEGTYFVDQAGHYYYQAKGESQPVMTISGINDADGGEGEEFIINPENDEDGAEEDAEESLPNEPGNNQILINNGSAYQRITVVPADTSSNELSYVLIVQQPDDKEGEQTDGDQGRRAN
ncbi:hypothetical protein QE152_g22512 [Popillia japonica]|uniref:Uncharacterized protein n=1 Tax=Popillia japonica TaxID=7064 RepID=A0AAW1KIL7_POPJA